MSSTDFKDRIDRLTTAARAKSQTARLREYFPAIETALAQGVKLEAILAELRVDGFDFEMTGFKSALYRIRKKSSPVVNGLTQKQTQQAPTQTTARQALSPVLSNAQEATPRIKSPEQLKKENPFMAPIELNKLYAQQYADDRPKLSKESIRELERKYGAKSQA